MGRTGQGKPQRNQRHKKHKVSKLSGDHRTNRKGVKPQRNSNSNPHLLNDEDKLRSSGKEFMRLKTIGKSSAKRKKRQHKDGIKRDWIDEAMYGNEKGMTKPIQPQPQFIQGENESEFAFLNRMDNKAREVIAKIQLEEKFGVDLEGEREQMIVVKKKSQKTQRRLQQLKEKKKVSKQKKALHHHIDSFENPKDDIKFGEVVSAPPVLTAKPRKAEMVIGKSGAKSLLLSKKFETKTSSGPPQRQVGKTLKRKLMCPAQQFITDSQRQNAIDNYRQLKKTTIPNFS